ncbi:MAG: Calx-beta domain-containing protein [Chthoniobacteraceae bacterium]
MTVTEGDGGTQTLAFTVTLSEPVPGGVTVDYATIDGSAFGGTDFSPLTGTLTFASDDTTPQQVMVTVTGDSLYELDETFSVELSNPVGDAAVGPNGSASTTILNDDAQPVLSVSNATQFEGNAGPGNFAFAFSLDRVSGVDVMVRVTTAFGSATSDDFVSIDQAFTIEAGLTSKDFLVVVNGDQDDEADETFTLNVDMPENVILPTTPLQATGTIRNDDGGGGLTISVSDTSATEGTNGGTPVNATFTVSLSRAATEQVTVNYSTANGTAISGEDYTGASGTVTFEIGETEKQVSILIAQDSVFEPNETFTMTLSGPSSGTLDRAQGTATIIDDDAPPVLTIAQGTSVRVAEGNNTRTQSFTLNLDHASGSPITVNVQTVDGTALAGQDYVALMQDVVFAAGETSRTFSITIRGDVDDELDESFVFNVTGSAAAVNIVNPSATVTLLNDDRRLTVNDVTIVEGNAGTTQAIFTVSLDTASTHEISLAYATANGTATAGPDYVANSGTLTFIAGETSKQIIVDVNGDTIGELDEFFLLNFTNVANAVINKTSVRGDITDDDVFLGIGDAQVIEGGAGTSATMRFTVTLLRATGAVTVDYATANGTALSGQDYTAATGMLSFALGETTKTFDVTVLGDATDENDETFTVNLSNATGLGAGNGISDAQGVGTIIDDEGLLTITDASLVEGNTGTANMVFVVNLLNRVGSATVTVNYSTADATAVSIGTLIDYTATNGTLVFAAGTNQQTISVPIRGDRVNEGDQTFRLSLANPSNASIGTPGATGTIIDDDPAPTLSLVGGSVFEGDAGTQLLVFTVNLNGGSELPVTVDFATQDGTATAGADYAATTVSLTFAPGETSQTVTVDVLGDAIVEGDETVTGTLSNAVNATIATASATGTIKDDDIVVSLTGFAGPVLEGNSGSPSQSMTVTLSSAPLAGFPVTVNFAVAGGTATAGTDFTTVTTSPLTFAAGETSKTINFNILGDTLSEADETFIVSLTGATNAKIGMDSSATATITDDDVVPTISIADATLTEGDSGTAAMNFTITLSAPSGQMVTVQAATMAGTATPGTDFTALMQTVTFAPGQTTRTFAVNVAGDTIDEQNETFTVALSGEINATLARGSATGTILDNDARSLSVADASVIEGDSGTKMLSFTVTLASAAAQTVTVDFITADGSALAGQDYVAAGGTLTFTPGVTSQVVDIIINGDTTTEADETFFLRLGSPTNAVIADGEANGVIINDEMRFMLVPVAASVVEEIQSGVGNTVTFKVVRSGDLTRTGSVAFTTADGTAVSAGARPDYAATSGTLIFSAGEEEKTISVALRSDSHFENDETFKVRLTSAVNGVLIDAASMVQTSVEENATIVNNDSRPTISINDALVSEGGTSATNKVVFTVRLTSGGSTAADETETITVDFRTLADGTARDVISGVFARDFNPVSTGTLAFAPGETSKTIEVVVVGDIIDEADETFSVKLDNAMAGATAITIAADTGIGTIRNDDGPPTLVFAQVSGGASNGDLSITEGSLADFQVKPRLQLSSYSEKPISVSLATIAGTATAGVDYIVPADFPATLTFAPGETSKELSYTIVGDSIRESDETFTVVVSNPMNVTISDGGAKITILNDDPIPGLTINSASVVEADSGTSNLVFTVSLLGATDRAVTVNYATAAGTAVSSGSLPDFVAASGTLTFAPGDTTRTISVVVNGDTWAEADEAFTVVLAGAANATLLAGTGTGTILNGTDSIIGVVVQDTVTVEGNSSSGTSQNSATFLVELTKTADSDVTFVATTRNGTAIQGADYTAINQQFTISAGQSSVNVAVKIIGDQTFESTESFFVGVSAVSNNATAARAEGRAIVFNDDLLFVNSRTLLYIDEDGDLATIKISQGSLSAVTLTFSAVNAIGGRVLQLIDFTNNPALFNGTDLSVTAEPQAGFAASGRTSDGKVDVGFIRGAVPDTNTLQFTRGLDFRNITIGGDLGKITAGDLLITPSISGRLKVDSLGMRGTATLPAGVTDNISSFLSVVNGLNVTGDVMGVVQVIGDDLGSINSLTIGGALRGDPSDASRQSGIIFFTGTLGRAKIGSIIGGAANDSGVINGNTSFVAKIGSLKVLGDIVGGEGTRSGRVVAKRIDAIAVDGDIIGGGGVGLEADGVTPRGSDSGEILATAGVLSVRIKGDVIGGSVRNTGLISSGGTVGSLRIDGSLIGGGAADTGVVIVNRSPGSLAILGDIVGGSGERSGSVQVGGSIPKITLGAAGAATGGNLIGGSGRDSGTITGGAGFDASGNFVTSGGTITYGLIYGDIRGGLGTGSGGVQTGRQITKLDVRGDLIGGDSPAASVDGSAGAVSQSGFVLAGRIQQMIIRGDFRAGLDLGNGLADSGSIRVHEDIASLTILGDVSGTAANRAIISAGNNGPVVNGRVTPAIGALTIGSSTASSVAYLDVLAGYSESGSVSQPRGDARSADAQIGRVTIKGSVLATNIVAGVDPGSDGFFGSDDDVVLADTLVVDKASVYSSIARVIIGGQVLAQDDFHGIVAQRVVSVTVGGVPVVLTSGPANDFKTEIEAGTNMNVNELLL